MSVRTLERRLNKIEAGRATAGGLLVVTAGVADTPAEIANREHRVATFEQQYPYGLIVTVTRYGAGTHDLTHP